MLLYAFMEPGIFAGQAMAGVTSVFPLLLLMLVFTVIMVAGIAAALWHWMP